MTRTNRQNSLFNTKRLRVMLRLLLNSWYLFGSVFLVVGMIHRMYILPSFLLLCQARSDRFLYVLGFLVKTNSRLRQFISDFPSSTYGSRQNSRRAIQFEVKDTHNDLPYVDQQIQTEESSFFEPATDTELQPNEMEPGTAQDLPVLENIKNISREDAEDLDITAIKHIAKQVNSLPSSLEYPGLASVRYYANELNLQIEDLKFASVLNPNGSQNSRNQGEGVQIMTGFLQNRSEILSLKDDIRELKSMALSL
ncbi:uncharacterized protein V1516DRAFT_691379 [Lipomyces oligophaga]|uniref:uncharacterized protein n=1 Tax=Lipomyces oligophaga TaxID=45792 RepID=UPI0034CE5719